MQFNFDIELIHVIELSYNSRNFPDGSFRFLRKKIIDFVSFGDRSPG